MEYGYPERRKSKNDKKAKARFNRYKKGGALRSVQMPQRQGQHGKHTPHTCDVC